MWCIPNPLDKKYIENMEDVLNIYAKPYSPKEPELYSMKNQLRYMAKNSLHSFRLQVEFCAETATIFVRELAMYSGAVQKGGALFPLSVQ